jgi:hypothetical protein
MTTIAVQTSDVIPAEAAAAAGSLVVKAAPCDLYDVNAVAGASAGFVMLFDAVAAPADGTVTPVRVWPLAANAGLQVGFHKPLQMKVGCVLVFSTTGPFTKTVSATAFLGGAAS